MMGCYSFPLHVGVHHPDVEMGIEVTDRAWRRCARTTTSCSRSGVRCSAAPTSEIAEAVEAARQADVCVVVLGDQAGLFGGGTSGEGCDVADLRLPGRQEELLEALLAHRHAGRARAAVRPAVRARRRQVDRLAAVVCGFYPGEEGGARARRCPQWTGQPVRQAAGQLPRRRLEPAVDLPHRPAREAQRGQHRRPDAAVPVRSRALLRARHLGGRRAPRREWPTDGTCPCHVILRNDADDRRPPRSSRSTCTTRSPRSRGPCGS